MKLSFCIPTLNRPEYLLSAIKSICGDETLSAEFEICIYNNFSNLDYTTVEQEIEILSNEYNITYLKGNSRLEIDQSMFQAISLSSGDFLFLLGDDDFILPNGLNTIIHLINNDNFDLVVFNALILNEKNRTLTKMFKVSDVQYTNLKKCLLELKNFCSYGNLLIKSKLINTNYFKYLEGTSHAYGCFWLSFFENYELGLEPKVLVCNSDIVCLRAIVKTYNLLKVTFEHSQKEFALYYKIIGTKSALILRAYEDNFWYNQSYFLTLLKYGMAGNDLLMIRIYNYAFYKKYFVKIISINVLSIFLKPFKNILRYFVLFNVKNIAKN